MTAVGLPYDAGWTIPFDAPHFPLLPVRYRGVKFHQVFFDADPAAVQRFLPDPLIADPEGRCVAVGLTVPFSTGYGAFNEAIVEQRCSLNGRVGWYCSHVWHDGPRGIAAGREIYGTPKIFSELEVRLTEGTMLTRAAMAGVPVVTISTTMETPATPEDLPDLSPAWRLKLIPRADRPEPAIKQLVDAGPATSEAVVHVAYRGRGTVHFEPSPLSDVTSLAPIRTHEAWYFENSYAEGFGRVDLDYLAPDPGTEATR
jgi:acetoacetate decarboxylase